MRLDQKCTNGVLWFSLDEAVSFILANLLLSSSETLSTYKKKKNFKVMGIGEILFTS